MKGVILILDGMGDRPQKELENKTPLEAAYTPHLDKMAERGICGIMDTVKAGIRPGSDTAHLTILGYDPYTTYTGRGPLEAAGVGIDTKPGDIAFRCNFATQNEKGIITDRRAGRIKSGTDQLKEKINGIKIEGFEDTQIIFKESTGYRSVLVLRGLGLSDKVSDSDPKKEGNKPKTVKPLDDSKEAKKTSDIINKFVKISYELLKDHPVNFERIKNGDSPANVILPRGVGCVPDMKPINEKYNINSACIAETGLIMGIGKLAGMDLIEVDGATGGVDTNLPNISTTIYNEVSSDKHDFYLINIDGADEAGHDGDSIQKRDFISKVDKEVISKIMDIPDTYFILTADHSTPVSVMDHSGDPVPLVINGEGLRVDDVSEFGERSAAKGGLCRIRGCDLMDILMDLMGNTNKFGA